MIPEDLVYRNPSFRPEMIGVKMPADVYVQIAGIDVIRTDDKDFYVLEDNARTPSGVSYMLENRDVMMRLFPDLSPRRASTRWRTIRRVTPRCSLAPTTASHEPPTHTHDHRPWRS